MPSWTFSPLGFAVLCRATGRDILPYPVQFRPPSGTSEDFENQWKAEAGALARLAEDDDGIEAAIHILNGPEARIEVSGFAGAAPGSGDLLTMGDPTRRVRILAAVHYHQAVLVIQKPTDDPESGGPVKVSLIKSEAVVRRLLEALPTRPRGTAKPVRVLRTELDPDAESPFTAFTDDAPRSPRRQALAFFNRPRTTILYIAICPGPSPDRRPTPARDCHIIDYPDGRYLLRHNDSVLHADPTDPASLQSHLHSTLTTTITAFRQDTDPTYT